MGEHRAKLEGCHLLDAPPRERNRAAPDRNGSGQSIHPEEPNARWQRFPRPKHGSVPHQTAQDGCVVKMTTRHRDRRQGEEKEERRGNPTRLTLALLDGPEFVASPIGTTHRLVETRPIGGGPDVGLGGYIKVKKLDS